MNALRVSLVFLPTLLLLVAISEPAQPGVVTWHAVESDEFKQDVGIVVLHGVIESGDATSLRHEILSANRHGILIVGVHLISPGGDVNESLRIGRLIRGKRLFVLSPQRSHLGLGAFDCRRELAPNTPHTNLFLDLIPSTNTCVCASACALAWLGGVWREGSVGLHHHYFRTSPESFDQFEFDLNTWSDRIGEYLIEMRAPSIFSQTWFFTSSSEVKFLDADTNEALRFDPIYREFLDAACGSFPPEEAYRYRAQQADRHKDRLIGVGEAYALNLLAQELDEFDSCLRQAFSSSLLDRQDVRNEIAE